MAVLECRQVFFDYGENRSNALERVDLRFPEGSFTALLGPNGAGNSTLLRLLSGLIDPKRGEVILDGRPLPKTPPATRARSIAYLPQAVHFAFPLTVLECVEMGRFVHAGWFGRLSAEDRRARDRALSLCDATALADRSLDSLSGGERQRVLLASALAQEPRILLLDEPTLSLDLPHQEAFFDVVRGLHRDEGLTVVVATHELNLAARNAERLVLLSKGRVASEGTPKSVLTPARVREVFRLPVSRVRGPRGSWLLVPQPKGRAQR